MTLCDASQKEAKPLSGVLDGCSCLALARTFPHCLQGGCQSQVGDRKGSLSTPSHPLRQDRFTQGCRCERPHSTTPNKCLHTPCSVCGIRGSYPHIQRHHYLLAILLYRTMGYLFFRKSFSWNIWAIFFNPQHATLCNISTFWSENKLKFGLNKLKICAWPSIRKHVISIMAIWVKPGFKRVSKGFQIPKTEFPKGF